MALFSLAAVRTILLRHDHARGWPAAPSPIWSSQLARADRRRGWAQLRSAERIAGASFRAFGRHRWFGQHRAHERPLLEYYMSNSYQGLALVCCCCASSNSPFGRVG